MNAKQQRLHLGCGSKILPGYVNTDIEDWSGQCDYVVDARDLSRFDNDILEEVYAKSVLEHLSQVDAMLALREWYRVLKPGGRVVIDVPDLERVFKAWLIDKTIEPHEALNNIYGPPRPRKYKYRQHLFGYTFFTLSTILLTMGFKKVYRLRNGDRPYQVMIVEAVK